ncbi:MAG TPA: cobalamin biosynthesis protein [Candidatus Obscuribacter sp.]|nr:cobalamin biosynthesis protein [Candidatus Obscuribacter sp.]HMY55668.1 cobalamin biosynthesis protein [Candidatus Obscuribacter sp.]HNB14776.1 cobalamin biosynthesis protein [Candidatus Obscuribacter sp.]HND04690.1 cobalamin biosynthesis protein [Candidatus Obscuribacter sp.]HND66724.1 cobalamin biosynthesis protein [Candidatus Obscuribacter sp.]
MSKGRNDLAIWLVRKEGEPLALELAEALQAQVFKPWLSDKKAIEQFREHFASFSKWLFIGTTGIASRYLQGLLQDKKQDPCLVVLDEGCGFAVSLAGGHEGGGNALAYKVAALVQAVPVVTTASESIKPLVVGIGCRKGVAADTIEAAVNKALAGRSLQEVREFATIDIKAQEPGLLELSARHDIPLRIFKQEDIAARQWSTRPSSHVLETVGVDGVCEPCALMASARGSLLVEKCTPVKGVAIAIVEDRRRKP